MEELKDTPNRLATLERCEPIRWATAKERYCIGHSPVGEFWIQLNREDLVLGIYLITESTKEKWVPAELLEASLDWAKLFAQEIADQTLFSNQLAEKEKTKR